MATTPHNARRASAATASIPSETWRRLSGEAATRESPPGGLDAAWNAAAGRLVLRRRRPEAYLAEADTAVARSDDVADLDEAGLAAECGRLRSLFRIGRENRDDVLAAYRLVREIGFRALGLRAHREQVAAALAIHDGSIAEMVTGEGKTLAASLAAAVAAWRGRGCHVLTFNDYLASRDAEIMAPFYRACGLTVAHVEPAMPPDERRRAYKADITYATKNDVAADFLRDRIALGANARLAATMLAGMVEGDDRGTSQLVLRGLDTAIIDEADSILIDEAVTPLILSGDAPNSDQVEAYRTAAYLAGQLERGADYVVHERHREIGLTAQGRATIERRAALLGGLWSARRRREELVLQALDAVEFYLENRQYVIQEGKVVIVDESTGRLQPDRTWRGGVHQSVEAKEGLEVNVQKETLARISFQRFFRMYRHLAGTSGTVWEARRELWQVYGLSTVVLPTHRPSRRVIEPDRVFLNADSKWAALVDEIIAVHASGRPILIGTRNVEASEAVSRRLTERGLAHDVLNAVRHAEEAAVVARAGESNRITVATNMAGRGTDIKLGPGVADLGGLHVIASERHETGRIDRQLFGRAARQGDPGTAVAFVSLDDEVCVRYAPRVARQVARRRGRAAAGRAVLAAQRRAERLARRQRQSVLRTDDWLDRFLGFTAGEA